MIDETSNDGKLKITLTANRTIKSIEINDELLKEKEQLEDYLIINLNNAIEKAGMISIKPIMPSDKGSLVKL